MSLLNWLRIRTMPVSPLRDVTDLRCLAIGGESFPLGATVDDLRAKGLHVESQAGYEQHARLSIAGQRFGLNYPLIDINCFAENRPIQQVWYYLPLRRSKGHLETIRATQRHLNRHLGRPTSATGNLDELTLAHSGAVISHATWRRKSGLWGVSWYGDVRREGGHDVSGMLYQYWDDEIAAAQPYLPALRIDQRRLEEMNAPTVLARVQDASLATPKVWRWFHEGAVNSPEKNRALLEAQRALYSPSLLFTPLHWNAALNFNRDGEFVAWQSSNGLLGVSTAHDTWVAEDGVNLVLHEYLIRPAKGPGCHMFRLGPIAVTHSYVEHGSQSINAAVASIKADARIEHRFIEDSDC
jgi:hypothetical protein